MSEKITVREADLADPEQAAVLVGAQRVPWNSGAMGSDNLIVRRGRRPKTAPEVSSLASNRSQGQVFSCDGRNEVGLG